VDIAVELKACLDVCCCALAEKDIEALECEIICSQNGSNIGFLYAAAALAPGAFFELLLARHSCELEMYETLDGHTLLHFASCYCNDQSLKVILERLNDPKHLFKVDSFGRNALHFVFGANRESLGVTETSLFSIFDSTYSKWVSLQECISKFAPESRGVFTLGGFLLLSRHTPRHCQSHLDLEIVLKILLRDMSQVLESISVPDYAMNNLMHYIARRSFRAHTAPQPERRNTRSRRTGVLRTLHSDCALVQDKFMDLVLDQEIERRDLKSLHKIFQVFQKTSLLTLVNEENLDGMTPLLLACSHGNSTVVALFILQLGADTACSDTLKRTPLHFAAECNDTHSFQLLLKCPGTDASAVDHRRQTALFRLASLGFESLFAEMTALLQTSGVTQVKSVCTFLNV
jgi:ankyrin repeat protein